MPDDLRSAFRFAISARIAALSIIDRSRSAPANCVHVHDPKMLHQIFHQTLTVVKQ